MDVTKILEADHRDAEAHFDKIEKADGADRQALVDELNDALLAHMELEERVLYPAMVPVTGSEAVEEGNTEHALARQSLEAMVGLSPSEPGFGAALAALKAGITHHVEEEETEIFPKLRSDGRSILDDIATPFMQTRVELGMPVEPAALVAAASKDELLAEAKSANVDGASGMTKGALADALSVELG